MSGVTLDELLEIKIVDAGGDVLAINGDGSINAVVSATDLDIRDLTHVSDSVKVGDGTDFLAVNGDGSINAVVSATDLDIRDLVNTQDSIAIGDETNLVDLEISDAAFVGGYGFSMYGVRQDAAGSPVSADGDAHPFVFNNDGELKVAADIRSEVADDAADSGNPIKVGSRAVDGALSAISASNDRADLISDMYRRVWMNDSANISVKNSAASVTTTAAEIVSSPLAGRRFITIQNRGNGDVYMGFDNTVTSSNGLVIPKGSSYTEKLGEDIDIWLISTDAGGEDVRILEAA